MIKTETDSDRRDKGKKVSRERETGYIETCSTERKIIFYRNMGRKVDRESQ